MKIVEEFEVRRMHAMQWYFHFLTKRALDVTPIITHRFDIDDYQPAFELMESGQSGKVILNWN